MAKTYDCRDNGGAKTSPTSTQSSGSQVHLLDKGPTLGLVYDYSGVVTGPILYLVNNGPTLGRQESAT